MYLSIVLFLVSRQKVQECVGKQVYIAFSFKKVKIRSINRIVSFRKPWCCSSDSNAAWSLEVRKQHRHKVLSRRCVGGMWEDVAALDLGLWESRKCWFLLFSLCLLSFCFLQTFADQEKTRSLRCCQHNISETLMTHLFTNESGKHGFSIYAFS